jgi:hypothetical protein
MSKHWHQDIALSKLLLTFWRTAESGVHDWC